MKKITAVTAAREPSAPFLAQQIDEKPEWMIVLEGLKKEVQQEAAYEKGKE